jgi:hypothetical protein
MSRGYVEARMPGGKVSLPLDHVQSGRLVFDRGSPELRLSAGHSSDRLFDATFGGRRPRVRVREGDIVISYPNGITGWIRHALQPSRARLMLSASIPWAIELRGGVHPMFADLRGLAVTAFDIHGGISEGDLWLPQPSGTLRVSIGGGVSGLTIHHPTGTPIRLAIRGGIGSLSIDGEELGGIGTGFRRESAGWQSAPDRLDVAIGGGVSRLAVVG